MYFYIKKTILKSSMKGNDTFTPQESNKHPAKTQGRAQNENKG